jgi:hypothetical protein
MTATAHTIVAGAIAARVGNPILLYPLAFGSHFLLDSIPHWDLGTNWKSRPKWLTGIISIAENLVGITVAYFIWRQKVSPLPLLIAICLAILPDWLEAPWYIFFANKDKSTPGKNAGLMEKLFYRIYKTENFFHAKTTNIFIGISTQILTVAYFIILSK